MGSHLMVLHIVEDLSRFRDGLVSTALIKDFHCSVDFAAHRKGVADTLLRVLEPAQILEDNYSE